MPVDRTFHCSLSDHNGCVPLQIDICSRPTTVGHSALEGRIMCISSRSSGGAGTWEMNGII